MQKLLFLCTGNTCRSPMAEYLFKKLALNNSLDIHVESRGIHAYGEKISENAAIVLKNVYYILDTRSHISRQLTIDDLREFDLILTMTKSHKLSIDKSYYNKVFTISEYASGESSDILDPYGQDVLAYERCIKQIERHLKLIIFKLSNVESGLEGN